MHSLQEQIKIQQDQLEQAAKDMATLRQGFHRLLEKDNSTKDPKVRCVSSVPVKADESYFDSYAHFGIHHEMLSVSNRLGFYILNLKSVMQNSRIL